MAAIAVAAVTATGGCAGEKPFLRVNVPSIELAATDVASHDVSVEASSSWLAELAVAANAENGTPIPDWLRFTYDTASENVLWIRATGRNESLDARSARVAVVSADALKLYIPVTQGPMNISLDVTPDTVAPFGPRDASTRTLTVATDLTSWEPVTLDGSWLTVTRDGETNNLILSAKNSHQTTERRDTVVVRPRNEAFLSYADSVAVVQLGADLVVGSEAMDAASFEIVLPAEGGRTTIYVYALAAWTMTHDGDAARVATDVAEGGSDTENGVPMVITSAANPSTEEEYTFTLTFTCGDKTYTYTCRQRTVQQE